MRLRSVLISTWLLLAVLLGISPAQAERVALVIGNSAYRSVSALPNPANDAAEIAVSLEHLGFAVTRLTNARFDEMRRALIDFGRQARGAEMAVVFFAGHGMEIGGENWLIPIDAELTTDLDVDNEALGLKAIMRAVSGATKLGLVILDACRNNPFATTMQRTSVTRTVARGFSRVEPADNVLVAYAARDGTTANDGSGRNSPFTTALLHNIETPGLEVTFMFRNIRDEVMAATKREQQPFLYGSLSSEQIFLRPPAAVMPSSTPGAAPSAQSATPRIDEAAQAWNGVKDTDSPAELRAFVARYDDSPFAAFARARLDELLKREAALTPAPASPDLRPKPVPVPPNAALSARPFAPRGAPGSCASFSHAFGTDIYCASSVLSPELGNSYGVRNLFGSDSATAWVHGTHRTGTGQWIVVEFDGFRSVQSVTIRNGYQKNADIFTKNSRVRRLRLVFSQGETRSVPLEDRRGEQTIMLDRPIKAYWIQFVIEDVFPGRKYPDTAISKLLVASEPIH